jgi:hypothetical protein
MPGFAHAYWVLVSFTAPGYSTPGNIFPAVSVDWPPVDIVIVPVNAATSK